MGLRDFLFGRKPTSKQPEPSLPRHNLGDLLIELGLITRKQLEAAIQHKETNADLMIGEALVHLEHIDRDTLRVVLLKQKALRGKKDRHVIDFAQEAARRTASMTAITAATCSIVEKLK